MCYERSTCVCVDTCSKPRAIETNCSVGGDGGQLCLSLYCEQDENLGRGQQMKLVISHVHIP